jgi:thiosulfate dehydrogenase [quinone] large subunit
MYKQKIVFIILRLVMGFIFLWAFFDKLFGLGFATNADKAWINGVSPTASFLSFATKGPFVDIFHSLAGVAVIDWLFMLGLLFVGLTLVFNKFIKWGCIAGSLMFLFMYLSLLWPENNPIIDEHIVYILVLILIAFNNKKETLPKI